MQRSGLTLLCCAPTRAAHGQRQLGLSPAFIKGTPSTRRPRSARRSPGRSSSMSATSVPAPLTVLTPSWPRPPRCCSRPRLRGQQPVWPTPRHPGLQPGRRRQLAHLINQLELDWHLVLETGQLHPETLVLMNRLRDTSRAPVEPTFRSEKTWCSLSSAKADAMYKSIELRKACCHIRRSRARALGEQGGLITGLRREQSGARADVPLIDTSDASRINSTRWPTDLGRCLALHFRNNKGLVPCRPVLSQHRLRALHPRRQPGRGLSLGALVVGGRIGQGMRPACQVRR